MDKHEIVENYERYETMISDLQNIAVETRNQAEAMVKKCAEVRRVLQEEKYKRLSEALKAEGIEVPF